MDAFYDELASGLPNGAALRAAKLRMIRQGRPASEWAAFTLVGDPSIRLHLRRPQTWLAPWLPAAGLAIVIAAYGLWIWRRRKRGGILPLR
jgi:LPXTG-motif cell wall-anchored protein